LILLCDTRQQAGRHDLKEYYWAAHGVEIRRTKLFVGDYTLPTNQSICIDTKKDIQEIVGDICGKQHERFRNECLRAQEAGIKLIVLIEDDTVDENGRYLINDIRDLHKWQNPRKKIRVKRDGQWVQKYPNATSGVSLKKAMITMTVRYGVDFQFVRKKDAGKRILELLGVNNEEGNQ